MEDSPRQKLRELVATHGKSVCDDVRRCEGLLRDVCGPHKREINVLVSALKEQVPAELLGSQAGVPIEVRLARLTTRLVDHVGLAAESAAWAVDSWALALGSISSPRCTKPQEAASARPRKSAPIKVARRGTESPTARAGPQPSSRPHTVVVPDANYADASGAASMGAKSTDGGEGIWSSVAALISVPFLLASSTLVILASGILAAAVVMLPLLALKALGVVGGDATDWNRLGDSHPIMMTIVGLVCIGLAALIAGTIFGWLERIREKVAGRK